MATSEWRPAKLDQLGHVGRGRSRHRPRNADFLYGGPYPFFQTGDIKAANYYLNDYTQTYSEAGLAQSKLWQPGTLCITIAANIAESAILGIEGCFPDSVVGFVVDPEKADVRFVKYYLEILKLRMQGISHGSTQDNLSMDKLLTFDFLVPPLPIQRRIAGILSAYDDLIENSQRRIKILEEMARRLYREWFVYFRFPGHEDCLLVDSPLGEIPEGWEVKPFSAIASYVNGYPFKPAELGPAGKPIIKIKELKAGIVADTPRNIGDEIPGKYHIHDGDVLFSWSADLDAYLWMGGDGLLNQHLFTVLPADTFSRAFCFHSLKGSMPRFRALSLGATMHHIKRSALDQVFTVVAPAPMRNRFDVLVEPIHQQLITISKQIQNLRHSRDLLLPRLLSGQIDVEALPEPVLSES
ncbi:restriction endonuclease subunit S [Synechococcus sp. BA-132 BA5]|uniref:restriction endonuclease subunit S n=1 Tax=Synechococcus sp. BA-132 BA5 TaxID=3110252 RepID=UPI002B200F90|nr:restriction endonuclease subunit S [Synechococcus sp. BA-132 BA5]MEA5414151.1 restriction endonuclease subunit S [Synechococcus sp. BA-132 BA5]